MLFAGSSDGAVFAVWMDIVTLRLVAKGNPASEAAFKGSIECTTKDVYFQLYSIKERQQAALLKENSNDAINNHSEFKDGEY